MSGVRLLVSGRGVVCVALLLPDAHLGFWRSLSEEQLCEMGRFLIVSGNGDVPEGSTASVAVWGDEAWLHVAGIDLAEETTISVLIGDQEADEASAPGAVDKLARIFERLPPPTSFDPVTGRSYLLYWEYEKAGYFHDLGPLEQFEASHLRLEIHQFPKAFSASPESEHRVINGVTYRDVERPAETEYWFDYGTYACVSHF